MAQTLDDALIAARRAVQFDENGQYKQAQYYYNVAIKGLTQLQLEATYERKLSEYRERVTLIQRLSKSHMLLLTIIKSFMSYMRFNRQFWYF